MTWAADRFYAPGYPKGPASGRLTASDSSIHALPFDEVESDDLPIGDWDDIPQAVFAALDFQDAADFKHGPAR
jgi:hypothetical protein